MAPPVWSVYSAIQESRLSKDQQVQPRRLAGSAPAPHSFRCSLGREAFAYQFAARAAAWVFLLASVMLTETAGFRYRATPTEVAACAFEARGQKMALCSLDKQRVESSGPQKGWEFNSALDNVAGLLTFGSVANEPGVEDAALQFYVGGTEPGMDGKHFAFASDRVPRASSDEFVVARGPPPDGVSEGMRQPSVEGWAQQKESLSRGAGFGVARWVVGCPTSFFRWRSQGVVDCWS